MVIHGVEIILSTLIFMFVLFLSQMMNVRGHFINPTVRDHYGNQPVFMAMCTPLITPDVKETTVQNSTKSYYSVHGLDMKYSELGHV